MIIWETLLAAPYGARLDALCASPSLVRHEFHYRLYRTAADQYLEVFEDPADGELKYRGFCWVASEGAALVIFSRQGGAAIGPMEAPPAVLLPEPDMLSAEAIAEFGLRTQPDMFSRGVNLSHQVSFGAFRYHYELVSPRPTDAPIAIEVDRDPDLHVQVCLSQGAAPNTRLKLTAPVLEGRIAFVHRTVWRHSLGAVR